MMSAKTAATHRCCKPRSQAIPISPKRKRSSYRQGKTSALFPGCVEAMNFTASLGFAPERRNLDSPDIAIFSPDFIGQPVALAGNSQVTTSSPATASRSGLAARDELQPKEAAVHEPARSPEVIQSHALRAVQAGLTIDRVVKGEPFRFT